MDREAAAVTRDVGGGVVRLVRVLAAVGVVWPKVVGMGIGAPGLGCKFASSSQENFIAISLNVCNEKQRSMEDFLGLVRS